MQFNWESLMNGAQIEREKFTLFLWERGNFWRKIFFNPGEKGKNKPWKLFEKYYVHYFKKKGRFFYLWNYRTDKVLYLKISWWFDSCDANESNSSTWQIDMTLFVFILLPQAKVLSIQLSFQYFWSVTCTNMTIPTYTHYTIHKSVE